ncbi:MAG: Asp23/Gls24 family envelope stress response protein [Ruminococcaceae bacterium]|nr:Asp23/Gls24 family envelope stress response protein [Oscillospiraceae bacterium]
MVKLLNENGEVCISANVITTLVGDAATNCFGVKGMALRSASDGLVHLLKREAMGKGVYVTYNDDSSISIDLHIVVDPGVNIPAICSSIISEVRYKVMLATGIKIQEVNVFVDSVSL